MEYMVVDAPIRFSHLWNLLLRFFHLNDLVALKRRCMSNFLILSRSNIPSHLKSAREPLLTHILPDNKLDFGSPSFPEV
ncbi:hypothetical protein PsorP6_015333 [Peronosclerospora sorghi]|uniref:Uncharacterized protein n=1 Tax=Peronosclerospora sorghi TaxID=230839 RepID=A0ACC0VSC1_9STRA|nr:hypothetical protein PsorP6_015333 [Peronosclerospora sorghi]